MQVDSTVCHHSIDSEGALVWGHEFPFNIIAGDKSIVSLFIDMFASGEVLSSITFQGFPYFMHMDCLPIGSEGVMEYHVPSKDQLARGDLFGAVH